MRPLIVFVIGCGLLIPLSLKVRDVVASRHQEKLLLQASENLAQFTHGPRRTPNLRGQAGVLEVPPTAVNLELQLAEEPSTSSPQQRKPAAQESRKKSLQE